MVDYFLLTPSITYNGSMESPVPLYPTDCPPPYEAVMGQRVASQVNPSPLSVSLSVSVLLTCLFITVQGTMFDPQATELSGERGTSTAFSGEGEGKPNFFQIFMSFFISLRYSTILSL